LTYRRRGNTTPECNNMVNLYIYCLQEGEHNLENSPQVWNTVEKQEVEQNPRFVILRRMGSTAVRMTIRYICDIRERGEHDTIMIIRYSVI
jgi:hypothetical protein